MSLSEAMEDGLTVTQSEALAEVSRHNINPSEFLAEMGHSDTYMAADVLGWLGY